SERGHILSNTRVLHGSGLSARFRSGRQLPVNFVARDDTLGIALLRVPYQEPLTFLPLGSGDLPKGATVYSIGLPVSEQSGLSGQHGVISPPQQQFGKLFLLRHNAAAIRENSGGPVLDAAGLVIGINAPLVFGSPQAGAALPIENVLSLL